MKIKSIPRILKEELSLLKIRNGNKFDDLSNVQVLTGMPRGGTTWLTEFFLQRPNTLYLHEPFSLFRLKTYSNLEIDWHQFIPENEEWPEVKQLLDNLLKARVANRNLILNTRNKTALTKSDSVFIKFVRLNRMLPWFVRNFPDLPKPIYIIRHPAAVVYSQMNHGSWNSDGFQSYYQYREGRYSEYYQNVFNIIGGIESFAEHLTLEWVLDTLPLYHERNGKNWATFAYEELLLNKNEAQDRLIKLKKDYPYDLKKLSIPSSSVAHENPLSTSTETQLSKWDKGLSAEDKNGINRILGAFGSSVYNLDSIEPDYSMLEKKCTSRILDSFL